MISRYVDLDGPTHILDFGGPPTGSPLVLVHGLGGSHVNWLAVGPRLAEHHRVTAIDLAGFGLTRPDHRRTDVDSNQRLLDEYLRRFVGEPAAVMGNSMGGMIAILQAGRNPETVSALALLDPSVPNALPTRRDLDAEVLSTFGIYATPVLGRAVLARMRRGTTPEEQVRRTLEMCTVDAGRVDDLVVRRSVELARERLTMPGVEGAFLDAARSVLAMQVRRREYRAVMRAVTAPVLVLHGERDRLVPVSAVRLLVEQLPAWELHVAPDIGHVPQMEAPQWTVDTYLQWI